MQCSPRILHFTAFHFNPPTDAITIYDGKFNKGEKMTYWLDNVDCNGTEDNLFACQSSGKGQVRCGRHHRAGVICPGMCTNLTSQPIQCSV